VFQHADPTRMIAAISMVVHEGVAVREAVRTLKGKQ